MLTLTTLTSEECWRRLGAGGVGRIGFDRGRGPRIHPVNYTVADRALYLRTAGTSELAAFVALFADGALVSFEVDQLDTAQGDRWSVLVVARADHAQAGEVAALRPGRDPEPAPGGAREVVVRLTPVQLSGRVLLDAPPVPGTPGGASRPRPIPAYWWG